MRITKSRASLSSTSGATDVEAHAEPGWVRSAPELNGAAVIFADGVEIPITESMIRKALDDLDQQWEQECQRRRQRMRQCACNSPKVPKGVV